MLPCPEALLEPFSSLLLMLCGDIEENPGPDKTLTELIQLVKETNERCIRIETNQSSMSQALSDLKVSHETVATAVADITVRLQTVEKRISDLPNVQQELSITRQSLIRVEQETIDLQARLDEAEDRSRRDNVLFYGLPDVPDEKAHQSEEKIITMARDRLDVRLSPDDIARAHRIGRYLAGKNRPLIAKFSNSKSKMLLLSKKSILRGSGIGLSEDFSVSTREARKKLTEFGIALKKPFKLRYKKLYAQNKCYVYDARTNVVCEAPSPQVAVSSSPRATRSGRPYSNTS